jgi:hypothetical protein
MEGNFRNRRYQNAMVKLKNSIFAKEGGAENMGHPDTLCPVRENRLCEGQNEFQRSPGNKSSLRCNQALQSATSQEWDRSYLRPAIIIVSCTNRGPPASALVQFRNILSTED